MDVDGALVDIDVVAPDRVEQLLAREDPAGALHQEFEQLELGRPEMQLAAVPADAVRLAVELDVAGASAGSRHGRAWPGAGAPAPGPAARAPRTA